MKVFQELQGLDWNKITFHENVNESFGVLIEVLSDSVRINSPVSKSGLPVFPAWFSKELIRLTIQKKILHRQYKVSLSQTSYNQFAIVRAKCKTLSATCFDQYINKVQDSIQGNPKIFWSYLKKLNNTTSYPSTMHLDGNSPHSNKDIANLFAAFFASVYSPEDNNMHVGSPELFDQDVISTCHISKEDVLKELTTLDVTKGPGSDSIPPVVVKYCAELLAPPLTLLYNRSLSSGAFPDIFKIGHIVPIHKNGSASDIRNYRPITILPILAKVFEKIVLAKIIFKVRNMLHFSQHGFLSNKSTATNLVLFQTYITEAFLRRHQVDSIELDFSKAFDRVSHSIMIRKLWAFGFRGPFLNWIESYLHGRKLQVRYKSELSISFPASSGVPQGSHLGPILFNLYINDVVSALKCKHLLFADDMKLFMDISTVHDAALLQEDINLVVHWCNLNNMSLNLDKCTCITFHRTTNPVLFEYSIMNSPMVRVKETKDLGVTFTTCLSWEKHVLSTCNKALKTLGLLFRVSKDFSDLRALRTLYCCLVRPHLEYCSVVWSPHQLYLKDAIEGVQRRFLRLVGVRLGFRYLDVPLPEISSLLNLPPLESRRFIQDTLFLHKLINGVLDCPALLQEVKFKIPSGTRSRALFTRTSVSTSYATNSPMIRLQRQGCLLPDHIDFFCGSLASFKRALISNTSQWSASQP